MSKRGLCCLFILFCVLAVVIGGTRPEECELEYETGHCRAMFPSFYFNPSTNGCEEFIYGGCGGNANRFATEEECLNRCGGKKRTIHEDQ